MIKKIFPKYSEYVCNTYPDNGFEASGENCVLQTSPEVTKARLIAGGTFFKSVKDGGSGNVNNITLECIVTAGSPPGTDNVVLNITDVDGSIQPISFTQIGGSPCGENGINNLRDILNAGSPTYPYAVMMPEIDDVQSWDAATQDAECVITNFGPIKMGTGLSVVAKVLPDGSADIRTGPTFTLFHIQKAETGNTGEVTTVDAVSEWDGAQWITYPSELYAAGSGSPALCNP